MKTLTQLLIIITCLLFAGCNPSYSTERVISLVPAVDETADPNAVAAEPVDPLDVLIVVEKIAAANGLEMYQTADEEASLLDIADSDDLLDADDSGTINVTHWRHPELPVYLTVTRNPDDILLLLNHTPNEAGKPTPEAKKLYETLGEQLNAQLPQ